MGGMMLLLVGAGREGVKGPRYFILAVCCALFVACGCDGGGHHDNDAGSDLDSDSDSDTDSDTDTDTDSDTDTDTDTDTDSDTDTDTCDEVDGGSSDGCVRYVDLDVASSGDGLSWETAFQTVQEGIDAAYASVDPCGKCQVWIVEGTYYVYVDGPDDTIEVKPGIELYGGFDGTETALGERDWDAHVTALDGHESEGSANRVEKVTVTLGHNALDGVAITGGQIEGFGAGVSIEGSGLEIRNCLVHDNTSFGGGGVSGHYADEVTLKNSSFNNSGGVGLGYETVRVEDCTFINDGLEIGFVSNGQVINCDFVSGTLSVISGEVDVVGSSFYCGDNVGIHAENASVVDIGNGYFGNCEGPEAGALLSEDSIVHVADTVFVDNESTYSGGGAATVMGSWDDNTFTNCLFYNNRSSADEGSAGALVGGATLDHCIVLNHETGSYMGGLRGAFIIRDSIVFKEGVFGGSLKISRSLFPGGGISSSSPLVELSDSVIAGVGFSCGGAGAQASLRNLTIEGGYGVAALSGCEADVWGSIIDSGISGDVSASYSYVWGGYPVEGNLSSDPMLVGPVSAGLWGDVYFDEALFQTELTDDTATWTPGELAGLLVNPDIDDAAVPMMVIANNTETTLWAWGNATSFAAVGESYLVIDLHLQPGSPAIDAGYGLGASASDVEGNARHDDPGATNAYDCDGSPDCVEFVDMGAYEYQP